MLTDIEIAQNAKMKKITEIAAELGISDEFLEPYGHYKAKISESFYSSLAFREDGKLILVTAINPTPAGEGKTTVSVGLADSASRAELPAAAMHRECPWRTSISTSQEICTLSQPQTTCSAQCWTTISSRETSCASTSAASCSRDALT